MAHRRSSPVWLHGRRVGELSSSATSAVRFTYDDSVLDEFSLNVPVLSCSLPTGVGSADARAFFAGLLPEGDHRRALASRAGVLDTDVFALLVAYGQDVAGAVVVGDEVADRPYAFAETYDEQSLLDEVEALASHDRPLAIHDDSELSIAGLQDKMLLVNTEDGQWARPVHGFPSTHILKVDDRMHRGLVIAEHTCLQIARAARLPAAVSELVQFGDLHALVIERFDRGYPSKSLMPQRIHQEDACQALGVDLELTQGRAKYESGRGISLRSIAELLTAWGDDEQLLLLLDRLVFTVLIGDADAHGKNIAFLHSQPGRIDGAPLYDTVPTALWPNLRTRAAMSIGGAVDLPQVDGTDIVREASGWGLPASIALQRVNETTERIMAAAQTVQLVDDPLAARTVDLVQQNARRILKTRPL
jgi:serine/threonine-protein kinase HipA